MDRSSACYRSLCVAVILASMSLMLAVAGCGTSYTSEQPDESRRVTAAISELAEGAGSAKAFKRRFAEGSAPPESERTRYLPYFFNATNASVDGDTATATVTIINRRDKSKVGTQSWTLVKVDERWRLKSAPLPKDEP